jgi:hypothetical protein
MTGLAALPMYDRPETREATDRFWAAIRDALRAGGTSAPETLSRDADLWALWQNPDLVLAQTCGLPFRARLHPSVRLVATPDFALPGCPPGHYNSVILGRPGAWPAQPRPAINDPLSQSGWAALHAWAAAEGLTLGPAMLTGAHAASAAAVAQGAADICAIDAQTWRLMQRAGAAPPLSERARTPPTPGLPYITAAARDPAPIRRALDAALAALAAEDARALGLAGLATIPAATYLAQPIPPKP